VRIEQGSIAKIEHAGTNTIISQNRNSFPRFQFRRQFLADRLVPGDWHLIRTVPIVRTAAF
jgi:hypothetical protein